MAVGLQCWDVNGVSTFDTTTMTGRIIGTRTVTPGYLERLTVPISSGKQLWWHFYVQGEASVYCYRATFVDPNYPDTQGPNQFSIQCDEAPGGGTSGTGYVFYGEY
jgi:hypothetical protein